MIFGSLTAWFLKEVHFLNLEICRPKLLWHVVPILQIENYDFKEVDLNVDRICI